MSELDRLVALAQRAEPDALEPRDLEARVRAARSGDRSIDSLIAEARLAEPEPLSDLELLRMSQRAAMTGRARHRGWTRRRVMLVAGVAAALAAASVTLVYLPRDPAPQIAEPVSETAETTHFALASGDRIVAATGARFHVELEQRGERRVRLESGAMLFDVRTIDGGQFSVATPNAEVVVLGTVFTVRATDASTTVHVYEGRVEIRGEGRVHVVSAGNAAHLGEGALVPDDLAAQGMEAAQARAELASVEQRAPDVEPESAPREVEPAERPRPIAEEETRTADDAPIASSEEPRPTVAEARAWIASGDASRALVEAERATRAGEVDPWRLVEGDALRALGRPSEAADAYRRAREELAPPRRQQAGFLEARLRAGELADADGALRALRDAGVSAPGSPLRERGLSLEAQLLARLGRTAELAAIAEIYLGEYPDGPQAEAMRAHLDAARPPRALPLSPEL